MTFNDLLAIINDPDMGGMAFQLVRTHESVDDKGRARFERTTATTQGNVQPAPGKDLERLPEGDKGKDTLVIYTEADLTPGGDADQKADRILVFGRVYRVALAEPWPVHAGYTRALAVLERVDV